MAKVARKPTRTAPLRTRDLTAKQRLFVAEFLVDLCATSAAKRAGYSARNADKIGPELLGKTRVAAAIQLALKSRAERTTLTQDEVIAGLRREAARTGPDSQHSARVKALEILARMGGYLPGEVGYHVHQHNHKAAENPGNLSVSSQEVIDQLPLEAKLAMLAALHQAREAKAQARLMSSRTEPNESSSPSSLAKLVDEPQAHDELFVIAPTARAHEPTAEPGPSSAMSPGPSSAPRPPEESGHALPV